MKNSDPIAERNALARQYQAQGDLGRAIALFEANLRECADLRTPCTSMSVIAVC